MSEYQYYEFRALDRPLTDAQMDELRAYSTRAQITPTSFVNEYSWGSFKGDVEAWMEVYFDAFVYVANWGSRRLMFRVPKRLLDVEAAVEFSAEESVACRVKGEHAILEFASETEDTEWEEGEGWLESLTPLRLDLLRGDFRSLYLGWLCAADMELLDDDEIEPPVPAGMGSLTEPLRSLAQFLRVDADWIEVAAEASAPGGALALAPDEIAAWAAAMAPSEKDAVIVALIRGDDPYVVAELTRRAAHEIRSTRETGSAPSNAQRRTVGELRARAESLSKERREKEAQARARAAAERAREKAEQRDAYLRSQVGKEESLWAKVDELIASKHAKPYDDAVSLLQDLRELAGMTGQNDAFAARMASLYREHAKKPALLERFRKANLIK